MKRALAHTIRYPSARTSTVVYLLQREKTTERLTAEVEARVSAILAEELETVLAGFSREQRERITESF